MTVVAWTALSNKAAIEGPTGPAVVSAAVGFAPHAPLPEREGRLSGVAAKARAWESGTAEPTAARKPTRDPQADPRPASWYPEYPAPSTPSGGAAAGGSATVVFDRVGGP